MSDLARLEVVGETRTSFDPKEYGLDAPKAKATVTFADKSSKVFSFGAPIPGTDAVAAAAGGVFGAVKFAPLAALSKPVDEYRSKQLFDVPTQEITRVSVTRGPNTVVVARTAKGDGGAPAPGGSRSRSRTSRPSPSSSGSSGTWRGRGSSSSRRFRNADLARVGLAPAVTTVVLEKGAERVATIGFGAQKAEGAGGRMYAKSGALVVVIDDRVREDLDKELSAYRESRVAPVDTFTLRRVAFDVRRPPRGRRQGRRPVALLRAGPSRHSTPKGSRRVLGRAEGRGFVPVKPGKAAPEKALATVDPSPERTRERRAPRPSIRRPPGRLPASSPSQVTGRPERLLVDRTVLDEIRREAAALRDEAEGKPKDAKARAKTPEPSPAPGGLVKRAPGL